MLALPAPHGWNSPGAVAWVRLERIGGPGPIDRAAVEAALIGHCCWPPAIPKILDCLEHSEYQCLMRSAVAREVIESEALLDAGVRFVVMFTRYSGGPANLHNLPRRA